VDRFRLSVKDHFDAAHRIKDYVGKCSRDHGHRWDVEVVLEGKWLNEMNILVDFAFIKSHLKSILDALDHYNLNEVLKEDNVTAELLAKLIYHQFLDSVMEAFIWPKDVRLLCVRIWESPECCVEYTDED
jgi:6-pyruvoyltetrahydropterin/6-carboxytetrahydropterin synthase